MVVLGSVGDKLALLQVKRHKQPMDRLIFEKKGVSDITKVSFLRAVFMHNKARVCIDWSIAFDGATGRI